MPKTPPNVLLITTDHWPGALLGVAGHPAIQTPTLDQLASSGTRFSRAYSECPVCIPARRTLMTGTSARTHGDRCYKERLPMPAVPTLAQTFRDHGYQAHAVGKLHVYPQRSRIGFDDVQLDEEGRVQFGCVDDYDLFLGDRGFAGRQFAHGMGNNDYATRPWHLAEDLHPTNWATNTMVRQIKRRDPGRPGFWYLGYRHPHPPLVPLQCYLDQYRDIAIDAPFCGEWARDRDALPYALRNEWVTNTGRSDDYVRAARRAFYALCTHIDHQLRIVIGTLREEKLLDNTIILFTADHGDMLFNHGLSHKTKFYENSAHIPLILLGVDGDERVEHHRVDQRLVGLQDVMPTLLELAGLPIPTSVEGRSMLSATPREHLYGEWDEYDHAARMVHNGRFKLIYYPVGSRTQLFDLQEDPRELHDLGASAAHAAIRAELTKILLHELNGGDLEWIQNGSLVGRPDMPYQDYPNRYLSGQRGLHWPLPPGEK